MVSELLPGVLYNINLTDAQGHRVDLNRVIFDSVFAHIPNPHWAAFAYSVSFTAVCFLLPWILYRKKIFLKV